MYHWLVKVLGLRKPVDPAECCVSSVLPNKLHFMSPKFGEWSSQLQTILDLNMNSATEFKKSSGVINGGQLSIFSTWLSLGSIPSEEHFVPQ